MKSKRTKPVAKPNPTDKNTDDIFGFFAGKITITGDVVSPALTPKEWGNPYPTPRPRRLPRARPKGPPR